jgi:ABC-type branched-subunit amino acid transport system ATPase component
MPLPRPPRVIGRGPGSEPCLRSEPVTKRFGGLTAVHESAPFERGKINAIIGPNGAGKTTFFNLVSGHHRAELGRASSSTART